MNIKDLLETCNPKAINGLQKIAQEAKELERIEQKKQEHKRFEYLKKHCFKSKEEMLTYLKEGNQIADYYGYPLEGLVMEDDKIKYTYMVYSEIDMPIGYSWIIYTEEEFMDNERMFHAFKYDFGYDSRWVKAGKH